MDDKTLLPGSLDAAIADMRKGYGGGGSVIGYALDHGIGGRPGSVDTACADKGEG
jgi:hypothetical protein